MPVCVIVCVRMLLRCAVFHAGADSLTDTKEVVWVTSSAAYCTDSGGTSIER